MERGMTDKHHLSSHESISEASAVPFVGINFFMKFRVVP